ncbi:ABC transporter ATP-binding protein [Paenibacillus alvei]|uniref:ABC transporter ATP-binding protein n=2 Tax=Paenibacillus TaxID=44249 RepID=A0ABT4GRX2_PAEAL|nr:MULTISPECIES: ABC transporter ATP-binding protein [Paenibacillus]MCY9539696.1 ABC transporter ATP-binding protein [Paenibacillus alvei]MCY9703219.1 ABC transporter ATP-binding protein [Paenibacillus alvei]MCY9735561.1 ABC transporter ATP-binding protein [Paenibacillus alvei]MCY9752958.1 ABC transporter ATP-binding protein [Paenibacillus alvei]MCY9759453.1 ABC transporter ATP-binding protein [Paenibacillus alvei]
MMITRNEQQSSDRIQGERLGEPLPEREQAALELRDVSMSFDGRAGKLHVLDHIFIDVQPGEFVSIIGPSGSGKSTLFHLIGGLLRPSGGDILVHGQNVVGQTGHISYMPQQPALFPWRTVEDNVILAPEIAGRSKKESRAEARRWLSNVGLAGYERSYPHELSGGMQQRVAFLRAMMSPHELMLLDEPFSALDALTRSDMQRWLLELWERNRRSVLFITHSIEEALLLSDTIYVLSNRPARVLERVRVPFARPRTEALASEAEFVHMKRELSELLRRVQSVPITK